MGFGIKSVTKSVKKGVGKVVKEARAPEKAIRQVPTNANDITGNTRRLLRNAPRNLNSLTGSVRDAWKTRGASVITGYPEGSKAANMRAVEAKQARQQAAAQAAQAEQQRLADEKKAAFDAKIGQARAVDTGFTNSLRGMRQASMPQGVMGARYGDINRYGSSRVPTQNMGLTAPPPAFNTGMAAQYQGPSDRMAALKLLQSPRGDIPSANPMGGGFRGPMGMTKNLPARVREMAGQSRSGPAPQGRPMMGYDPSKMGYNPNRPDTFSDASMPWGRTGMTQDQGRMAPVNQSIWSGTVGPELRPQPQKQAPDLGNSQMNQSIWSGTARTGEMFDPFSGKSFGNPETYAKAPQNTGVMRPQPQMNTSMPIQGRPIVRR